MTMMHCVVDQSHPPDLDPDPDPGQVLIHHLQRRNQSRRSPDENLNLIDLVGPDLVGPDLVGPDLVNPSQSLKSQERGLTEKRTITMNRNRHFKVEMLLNQVEY